MKGEIVTGMDFLVAPWIFEKTGGTWNPGRGHSIGLRRDGEIVAGALYEDFNGVNMMVTLAGEGKYWLNRDFLWFMGWYPFEQVGCKRLTALIAATNAQSIKFSEKIGFVLEATLKEAHPTGDLLVYRLMKEDCRWLKLKGDPNGKRNENSSCS